MNLLSRIFGYFIVVLCVVTGTIFAIPYEDEMYGNTEKAVQQNSAKYYTDATKGLSIKLNTIARENQSDPNSDPGLASLIAKCKGGDLFTTDLDQISASLMPGINQGERSNFSYVLIASSLNKNIGNLTPAEGKALDTLVGGSLQSLKKQTDSAMSTAKNIKDINLYTDGDEKNSPFDLVADVQKLMKLFLKDPLEYMGLINTMNDDANGLITGRFETGNWAQGTQYEIDLASDISSALGQKKEGSSGGGGNNESDCSSGFCITLDIITNESYFSGGGGRRFVDANFEEIFGSAHDFLIKKGDKRNLACKTATSKNHFQSNNDLNLFFKNIFRGLGIFVFQKTPPFAKPKAGTRSERTALQKEKDTDDVIANYFKNSGVDPKHLLLGRKEQIVEGAALRGSTTPLGAAQNVTDALRKTGENDTIANELSHNQKAKVNTTANTIAKNIGGTIESTTKSFGTMMQDLLKSLTAWKNKPPCGN
ncbi:MAG: hypothetical protein WC753_00380 [Candidatus Gracilibacteria bacterium]